MTDQIMKIKKHIDEAEAILITAGAGMGVDSGLPDFRGNEGFWKAYPKAKELKLSFESLANPYWFDMNPAMAWAFYGHRYNLYKTTKPHKGFNLLLEFIKKHNKDYFVYTTNVDGQFQKVGFDTEKIFECHGSINHFQCSENCKRMIWESEYTELEIDMDNFEAIDIPQCSDYKDIARPNILMFGDVKWNSKRSDNQEGKFNRWIKQFRKEGRKLVIIEIGAGTFIPTLRFRGEHLSRQFKNNIKFIRINPREFEIEEDTGYSLPYGAVEGLEKILG